MERISAPTFFVKRILPFVWFGIVLLVALATLWVSYPFDHMPPPMLQFVFAPLLLSIAAGVVFYMLFARVADTVDREGEHLLIRRGAVEQRVAMRDILDVSKSAFSNPPRIFLRLRTPGVFGSVIAFIPKMQWRGLSAMSDSLRQGAAKARDSGDTK